MNKWSLWIRTYLLLDNILDIGYFEFGAAGQGGQCQCRVPWVSGVVSSVSVSWENWKCGQGPWLVASAELPASSALARPVPGKIGLVSSWALEWRGGHHHHPETDIRVSWPLHSQQVRHQGWGEAVSVTRVQSEPVYWTNKCASWEILWKHCDDVMVCGHGLSDAVSWPGIRSARHHR